MGENNIDAMIDIDNNNIRSLLIDTPENTSTNVKESKIEWSKETIFNHTPVKFNEVSGFINLTGETLSKECDYFMTFFTLKCVNLICTETNRNATQQKEKLWTALTKPELLAFLGVSILMGTNYLPEIEMYWSSDKIVSKNILIQRSFTRDRYLIILKYLRLYNSDNYKPKQNVTYPLLYKIQNMIDIIQKSIMTQFMPYQNITCDEIMVPFRGRIKIKQYMRDKPTKWGFKIWAIACSKTAYIYAFDIYLGKTEKRSITEIVLDLVKTLPNVKNKVPWHLFCDNYFTSIQLGLELLKYGIYLTGTFLKDRINYPIDLKLKLPTLKYNETDWSNSAPHLFVLAWYDTKIVSFLTTYYNILTEKLPITRKKHNKTIKNDSFKLKQFIIDAVIVQYNKYMKGVDQHDQHVSYYRCQRKCRAWWKPLFWYLIELVIANSRIVWNLTSNKKPSSILNYRNNLACQLIGNFSNRKISNNIHDIKNDKYIGKHYLQLGTQQRICQYCSTKEHRVRSRYFCKQCSVNLCVKCHENYHSKK